MKRAAPGRIRPFALLLAALAPAASAQEPVTSPEARLASWEAHQRLERASPFAELEWRHAGPRFQGGRIESVASPAGAPFTFYVAPGAGNLWKTRNNGLSWEPVFEHQATFAIGDVKVAPSDPEVVWVGTGEAHLSGTSYAGIGIYRSADGGKSWENRGLCETQHVGKVVVDPADPDVVYVAAIGRMRTPNAERGVFKTIDGGESWEKVLFVDEHVGAIELVMDPYDPATLWAAFWQRGGGAKSGVWRTRDAGESWERLEGGLPTGDQVGRIALDAAASAPGVVYALVVDHSKPGGGRYGVGGVVLRSDDRGDTWRRTHEGWLETYVGWDFCDVKVSPDDAEQVYVCGMHLVRSDDGGASWRRAGEKIQRLLPHRGEALHLDQHDLWIDPSEPDRLLLGNDGGLFMSWDRGDTWLHLNNLPIGEFYTAAVDMAEPYNIWGGTQDNASLFGPSTAVIDDWGADPWRHVFLDPWAGGDGFATFPDPTDPNVVYYTFQLGDMRRKPLDGPILGGAEGEARIRPKAARGEPRLRFAWSTPMVLSHHDPRTLYCAAQRVFRSENRGDDWTCISPDLTVDEPDEEGRDAILALSESPLDPALVYVASGRGDARVTRDGGGEWARIGEGLPPKTPREILASRHEPGRVFAALSGKGDDDFQTYLFRSEDFGESWESIAANLPPEPVNAIAEDPTRAEVLYLGTDLGVYASLDRGGSWVSLCGGLPTVSVQDLAIQPRDRELVIATHGRSMFVLDVSAVQDASDQ